MVGAFGRLLALCTAGFFAADGRIDDRGRCIALARICWTGRTALLSALLISTSAFVTLYLHDIRMYTMWMWLVVAHHWLYWLLSQRQATRLTWLLFVLTVPLLLYTHFFSVVYLAALGLYPLVFMRASRNWLRVIVGWVLGGLFFAPYLPLVVDGIRFQSRVTSNALGALEPVAPLRFCLAMARYCFSWLRFCFFCFSGGGCGSRP